MAIQFSCEFCSEEFRLRDETAGKAFKCKSCGATLRVPFAAVVVEKDVDDFPALPPLLARGDSVAKRRKKSGTKSGRANGSISSSGITWIFRIISLLVLLACIARVPLAGRKTQPGQPNPEFWAAFASCLFGFNDKQSARAFSGI